MKHMPPIRLSKARIPQYLPILWFLVTLLIAILGGIFLFSNFQDALTIQIITTGLDTLRAQLVSALLLTAGGALIGATFTRRKLGAIVGATIVFGIEYLQPFIQLETQPVYDAGNHLKPLDVSALNHTSLVMVALGLLSAFIGSAIGVAVFEAVLQQPYKLISAAWRRGIARRTINIAERDTLRVSTQKPALSAILTSASRWAVLACLIVLAFFAAQSGDLFVLSPDASIHLAPKAGTIDGIIARGKVLTVNMKSAILGGMRSFEIYLPPTYPIANKRYPTLYLLHGSPGKISDWITGGKAAESADTLIGLGQTPEMIMVMPDGNGRGKLVPSEWANSGNHQQLLETYVAKELVAYVDKHYRTIADVGHRAIGGLSMGGFGATNIAIHHPDVFGSVISLGGYYTSYVEPNHIWGTNASYRFYNSPLYQIKLTPQAWKEHFFLGAATQDQPYYKLTIQFANELKQEHIPYTLTTEPGHHAWKVWADQLYRAMLWLKWGPNHTPPMIIQKTRA